MLRPARVATALVAVLVLGGTPAVRAEAPAFLVFDAAARHLTVAYAGRGDVPLARLLPDARATLEDRCAEAPACPAEVALAVLDALLAVAGDAHTRLLAPEAFARLLEANVGAALRAGVGLRVQAPSHGLGLVVLDVASGTPAAAAGLARGDRLVAVNGAWLPVQAGHRRAAWDRVVAGAPVVVRVVRAGLGTIEVRLDAVPVPVDRPPRRSWLGGDVAWVHVPSLVPARTSRRPSTESSGRPRRRVRSDSCSTSATTTAARTASAAEALAYELQRAGFPVVGEATAGMANAAVVLVPLPEGYGLVLTVALAVDADGVALPDRVVPDVLVPDDLMALADGEDRVLEAGWRLVVGACRTRTGQLGGVAH